MNIKEQIKKMIPQRWLAGYHKFFAQYAARRFHYPANKLIVIGVTGTKGKSTTCNAIWHVLTQAGYTVGMTTTVNFRIGDQHTLNDTKMTMLGRTQLQRMLQEMVDAGCQYAVVETSSEGVKQFRHLGINYDVAVFTNLHPEHLDAHGGLEPYTQAKLDFFRHVSAGLRKQQNGITIPKAAVINGDADSADRFIAAAQVPTKVIWSQHDPAFPPANMLVRGARVTESGVAFEIGEYTFTSQLRGEWNIDNLVAAIGVGITQGMSYPQLVDAIRTVPPVPGRMEMIDEGQPFTVVVDYAYEPTSLALLYTHWRTQVGPNAKLITLISSTGGGRDVWRRPVNGKTAVEHCDYVIATNEDPYDEDPQVIINQVAGGALAAGAKEGENFWRVPDRTEAIRQACGLAQPGDVVFLTAKGAEQKMCIAKGKKIDWDDRVVVRTALRAILRAT